MSDDGCLRKVASEHEREEFAYRHIVSSQNCVSRLASFLAAPPAILLDTPYSTSLILLGLDESKMMAPGVCFGMKVVHRVNMLNRKMSHGKGRK